MVNPSYNGSFKFPSRSIGSRKSSMFSGRQSARTFNFNRRQGMVGQGSCPPPMQNIAGFCDCCVPDYS
jgi:hypothetical protein